MIHNSSICKTSLVVDCTFILSIIIVLYKPINLIGLLAQAVEHLTSDQKVTGSSPVRPLLFIFLNY